MTNGSGRSNGHLDRALGCFVGLAVGDAVGTAVEFKPRHSFPYLRDMVGGGAFNLKAGQWTDDTSMSICLAESLLKYSLLDSHDLMKRFLSWFRGGTNSSTGTCFDIGNTTVESLKRFEFNGDPMAGSKDDDAAGNGSIMRLAPVAAMWWRYPNVADEIARFQSLTTHAAPDCLDACSLLSRVLCRAISGEGIASLKNSNKSWSKKVNCIGTWDWYGIPESEINSSGYVIETLEAAFWAVSRADNFEEAVLMAANLGEDADTVAAVTGQIAGAIWGLSGIPKKWVKKLHHSARIKKIANDLFERGTAVSELLP